LIRQNKDQIQQEEFKIKAVEEANKRVKEQIEATKRRQKLWQTKHDDDLEKLAIAYTRLSHIDIECELLCHKDMADYSNAQKLYAEQQANLARLETAINRESKLVTKLAKEIETLKEHKCYACGQDFHDEQHNTVLTSKQEALDEAQELATKLLNEYNEVQKVEILIGTKPETFYDTEAEAIKHSSQLANILSQIESKSEETDPYKEQIEEMEHQVLQTVNFDEINKLTKVQEHQKFLLDILTSKDSFVRKKIIDQNLSYLNQRLTNYLDKIGLPHTVVFKNDLQVEITELGRELDFDNLSRGERNRLILGLSFAFRDVWESLYSPINTLFIDELIDSGLDTMGVENSVAILKDMSRRRQKSIWLISHREELAGRVPNVLKVVKENGFTSYSTAVDIE
jgi:chromosome segregation ATPase